MSASDGSHKTDRSRAAFRKSILRKSEAVAAEGKKGLGDEDSKKLGRRVPPVCSHGAV